MKQGADFVDVAFAIMDANRQPLDFAVLLHLAAAPSERELREGAARAFAAFPKSAMGLSGKRWRGERGELPLVVSEAADVAAARARVREELASTRFPPTTAPAVHQRLVRLEGGRAVLATRAHHALGDLTSLVAWLRVQLEGAPPMRSELRLRKHARAARLSRFAFDEPAEPIAPEHGAPSGRRDWAARALTDGEVRAALRVRDAGFTYNDLLAAVWLATLREWNEARGGGARLGLWMPVNVRDEPFAGFGNGSSRIRVYDRAPQRASWCERARLIREQVEWSKSHGEWAVPARAGRLLRLPAPLLFPLLRRYFRRDGVDMATTLFSHVPRLCDGDDDGVLPRCDSVEIVSHLYDAHAFVLAALGLRGVTHFSFTWDAGRFSRPGAEALIARFFALRELALAEVRRAA